MNEKDITFILSIINFILLIFFVCFYYFYFIRRQKDSLENIKNRMYSKFKEIDFATHMIETNTKELQKHITELQISGVGKKTPIRDKQENAHTDFKVNSKANSIEIERSIDSINPINTNNMKEGKQYKSETFLQKLCRIFNTDVDNNANEFIQLYKPIRISVENAMDRRRSPDISPIFKTATDGDYYAVEGERGGQFWVVPRVDIAFQETSYGPGAMGLVFNCPNYDPQLRYHRVKVVKPAIFEPDSSRQHWTRREKGELDIGIGE